MRRELADTLTGYLFHVFTSDSDEPGPDRPTAQLYVRSRADARFLESELNSALVEQCGQSICTSDDSVFRGTDLPALEQQARAVRDRVEAGPSEWPVLLGYAMGPDSSVGQPINELASRDRLTQFLDSLIELAVEAQPGGRYLHFGGGE